MYVYVYMNWVWLVPLPTRKDAVYRMIPCHSILYCRYIVTIYSHKSSEHKSRSLRCWSQGIRQEVSATILIQCWQRWHTYVVLKRSETNWGLVWPRSRLRQMSATNVSDKCQRSVRSSAPWASSALCSVRSGESRTIDCDVFNRFVGTIWDVVRHLYYLDVCRQQYLAIVPWYCSWGHDVQRGVML